MLPSRPGEQELEGTPGVTDRATELESALAGRVASVARHLLSVHPSGSPPRDEDTGELLERLVASVAADPNPAALWALLAAVCAAYPTRDDMDRVRRRLQLADPELLTLAFLEAAHSLAAQGDLSAEVEVVPGAVLVDVDFSAKHDLNTGIQRVCRSLLPIWTEQHGVVPVAWNVEGAALRRLTPVEEDRVLRWGSPPGHVVPAAPVPRARKILIPWRGAVVMIETPGGEVADRLACLGDRSGNDLLCVVHDAIPVISSDLVLPQVASSFVRYLTAVKFASRVAAVSESAAEEFGGYVQSLPVQGLLGPEVITVPLGGEPVATGGSTAVTPSPPMVLVVGAHDPRKNHLTVLHSAETLWREGLSFRLQFIGAGGWGDAFPDRVEELRRAGRPVTVRRGVSEAELKKAYASAAFSVFPSLHEGYGLPVVESLAMGTPVVTSAFGSMQEIASLGGALTVDPRDPDQLTAAMRRLLTERETLADLRGEISQRPPRPWQEYADELWERLVLPTSATWSMSLGQSPAAAKGA
jgi:glycosyltransferase involved in cell wall biosynthesis